MIVIFWFSLIMVVFVYAGYPLCLLVLSKFQSRITQKQDDFFPTVSLVIAAYNEEKVLAEKLENALGLDYPKDCLQIVVASDGSTDATNRIAESFMDRGVILCKVIPRGGKTRALNTVVPQTHGEILVLSDANAMYQPDAIRKLTRHFYDPSVGAVSGDVRLVNAADSFAASEGLYYQYERWLQLRESEVGSIIGADGGMYALRRGLFQSPPDFIVVDDFVISMSVAIQGSRVVYDPEAVAIEGGTESAGEEFRRKIRIVAGGIQALKFGQGVPGIQQPLLVFCYMFHKLFRWLVPVFLLVAFVSSGLLFSEGYIYQFAFICQLLCYLMALGYAKGIFEFNSKTWLRVPYYFCLVNGAALVGIWKGTVGAQAVTWQRTSR